MVLIILAIGALLVSPGLRSRPSLSVLILPRCNATRSTCVAGATVPAFVERDRLAVGVLTVVGGVAGATVPAFVERDSPELHRRASAPSVAGATVPAFVERYPA